MSDNRSQSPSTSVIHPRFSTCANSPRPRLIVAHCHPLTAIPTPPHHRPQKHLRRQCAKGTSPDDRRKGGACAKFRDPPHMRSSATKCNDNGTKELTRPNKPTKSATTTGKRFPLSASG